MWAWLQGSAQVGVFLVGLALVVGTLLSAVRTFVLPRSAQDALTRLTFVLVRRFFELFIRRNASYLHRDRVLALYAPIAVLAFTPMWLGLVCLGYTAMFWGIGLEPWQAFRVSGSSLLTLGVENAPGVLGTLLMFSEAAIGMALVALLIAYLPTMYAAFSKRETAITLLAVRAGDPASALEMLKRYHRIHGLGRLREVWAAWEIWFAELEESHTSLTALNFFRSPAPEHSWVVGAGAVLDAAALFSSVIDAPLEPQAHLCIRAGYLALRHICGIFNLPYNANPKPTDPISIARAEFDAACAELEGSGLTLKADRDQAWRDFAGWRVNYDVPLLALCTITNAPAAPWSSDRAPQMSRPPIFLSRRHLPPLPKYEQ